MANEQTDEQTNTAMPPPDRQIAARAEKSNKNNGKKNTKIHEILNA